MYYVCMYISIHDDTWTGCEWLLLKDSESSTAPGCRPLRFRPSLRASHKSFGGAQDLENSSQVDIMFLTSHSSSVFARRCMVMSVSTECDDDVGHGVPVVLVFGDASDQHPYTMKPYESLHSGRLTHVVTWSSSPVHHVFRTRAPSTGKIPPPLGWRRPSPLGWRASQNY